MGHSGMAEDYNGWREGNPGQKELASPAQKIALWADKLRDIAANGLRFADSIYERDRCLAVQKMAGEMLALAAGKPEAEIEPLLAPIISRPTPLAVGDAAIINESGQILLIQRADNAKWAMPGGALDVGETPAEGVVREAHEETGISCEPVALVGVFDSRMCATRTLHHLYHFVFLCRPVDPPQCVQASHRHETLDMGWFAESSIS